MSSSVPSSDAPSSSSEVSSSEVSNTELKHLVFQTLQEDSKQRFEGNTGDLFSLESLVSKDWDFSLPTITRDERFEKKRSSLPDIKEFVTRFYNRHPELLGIESDNLLIAGGAIASILDEGRRVSGNNDIDMFIYGCDEAKANEVLKNTFARIIENMKNIRRKELNKALGGQQAVSDRDINLSFRRTANSITMRDKYSIILRLYKTKNDILHGFDIGSSAAGFDLKDVYFTTLGKFSYEYGCNIVDTTRRSTTYEHRLSKYFERGFDIILPQFNSSKLENDTWESYNILSVCRLPYMSVSYTTCRDNKIYIKNFLSKYKDTSDYTFDIPEYVGFYMNVSNLMKGNYDKLIFFEDTLDSVLNPRFLFTKERVDFLYNCLLEDMKKDSFSKRKMTKYFPGIDPILLFNADKKTLETIVREQAKAVYRLAQTFEQSSKVIKWKTLNPQEQIVGSFNPIIEEPKKWYGEYFTE